MQCVYIKYLNAHDAKDGDNIIIQYKICIWRGGRGGLQESRNKSNAECVFFCANVQRNRAEFI